MRIKMKTTSAGPDVAQNWNAGQVKDVSLSEAIEMVDAGLADAIDPLPAADADFSEGGYVAKHKGGGSWQIFGPDGAVVEEGLKKGEAIDRVEALNAPAPAEDVEVAA
jgi:hypothetical protein